MSSKRRRGAVLPTALLVVAMTALAAGSGVEVGRTLGHRPSSTSPLGSVLPTITLSDVAGRPVVLRGVLAHPVTAIFVVGASQCASCSRLQLEVKVVQTTFPKIGAVVVGSGPGESDLKSYFHALGLDSIALLDSPRAFLHAVALEQEPATLLVDSTGRVLFVDSRATSEGAQYPIGRILHQLAAALATGRE